ncbi:hypothetical protein [Bacillus sinesaloumensis]|uniref:hypothetical protein n=1 Tax=Litchfieldia sinesaloumensis TaxID=1926280 RepID=UPI0009889478|nr:hypothetical protein [Bacillus sinesaloumensis]
MKRKLIVGIVLLVASSALIYYFNLAKPSHFLSKEELLAKFPDDLQVSEILDIIELDERHVYVPIKTNEYKYGMSLWIWSNHKWQLGFESTTGGPKVVKLDNHDPSSYRVLWNIHPDDEISYGELFLIRNRNFRVTEGIHHYYPRLQMSTILELAEAPYGMTELPKEWQAVMESLIQVEEARQPDPFWGSMFPVMQDVQFSWIPYNNEQVRVQAHATMEGGGSWGGGIELLHVGEVIEEELEYIDR